MHHIYSPRPPFCAMCLDVFMYVSIRPFVWIGLQKRERQRMSLSHTITCMLVICVHIHICIGISIGISSPTVRNFLFWSLLKSQLNYRNTIGIIFTAVCIYTFLTKQYLIAHSICTILRSSFHFSAFYVSFPAMERHPFRFHFIYFILLLSLCSGPVTIHIWAGV